MTVSRNTMPTIHQRSPRMYRLAPPFISARPGEEVLARRGEDVDQRPRLERDHAVLDFGDGEEAVAAAERPLLVADRHLEAASGHPRHLPVRMVVQRADRALGEVDAD